MSELVCRGSIALGTACGVCKTCRTLINVVPRFVPLSEFQKLEQEHIDVINDALKKLEAKDNEISKLRFELSKLRAEIHG